MPKTRSSSWMFCGFALAASIWLVLPSARCAAQPKPETADEPAHYIAMISSGVPLRLTVNDALGQTRVAPAFVNAALGYVLPSAARFRHGFGLDVATNLTHDGGYTEPLYAGEQWALTPAYWNYLNLNRDMFAIGHVGVPIALGVSHSFGLELGALLDYRVLAGVGVFARLDLSAFVGLQSRINLLASVSLGLSVDYEVLP